MQGWIQSLTNNLKGQLNAPGAIQNVPRMATGFVSQNPPNPQTRPNMMPDASMRDYMPSQPMPQQPQMPAAPPMPTQTQPQIDPMLLESILMEYLLQSLLMGGGLNAQSQRQALPLY